MTEFCISKAECLMDEDGLFGVEIGMGEQFFTEVRRSMSKLVEVLFVNFNQSLKISSLGMFL